MRIGRRLTFSNTHFYMVANFYEIEDECKVRLILAFKKGYCYNGKVFYRQNRR